MTREEIVKFMSEFLPNAESIKEVEVTNTFFIEKYNKNVNKLEIYVIKDKKFNIVRVPEILYPTFYANRFVKVIDKYICVFDIDVYDYEFWGKDVCVDLSYIIDTSVSINEMTVSEVKYAICDYPYYEWNSFSEGQLDRAIQKVKGQLRGKFTINEFAKLLSTVIKV